MGRGQNGFPLDFHFVEVKNGPPMATDWSRAVQREYVGGDVRFDFPARPLGWFRLIGILLIGFSVLFDWGPAKGIFESLARLPKSGQPQFEYFSVVFQFVFVLGGLIPAVIGSFILFGRCRVVWKEGRLQAMELLGPLWWKHRLPRKVVTRLEVAAASSADGRRQSAPKQFDNFSSLMVVFEDETRNLMVVGYPKEWLLGVAEELKGYVGGRTASISPVKVAVVETTLATAKDADVPEQPADSRVQLTHLANGIHLIVPPAGLWRGSKGLFFGALLWCSFIAFFSVMFILPSVKKEGSVWGIALFLSLFWLVGFALLAFAVNMGRRSAELVVEENSLRLVTKGLLGSKQRNWPGAELAAIRADSSGMEVNGKPVIELQIHPRTGKKVGLLAGQNAVELRWIATRLRQALELPAR